MPYHKQNLCTPGYVSQCILRDIISSSVINEQCVLRHVAFSLPLAMRGNVQGEVFKERKQNGERVKSREYRVIISFRGTEAHAKLVPANHRGNSTRRVASRLINSSKFFGYIIHERRRRFASPAINRGKGKAGEKRGIARANNHHGTFGGKRSRVCTFDAKARKIPPLR